MKNRDNEFFREEELDELVENISKFFQKRKSGKRQHLRQQKLLFRLFTGIWKRRRNMLHM